MVRLTIRVPAKIGSPWAARMNPTKSQSWWRSVSNRTVLMVRIGMGKR